jgi:hypothetical protein
MTAYDRDAHATALNSDDGLTHFVGLRALHRTLDRVFAVHQELLVLLDFQLAVDVLEAHLRLLRLHMKHEEHWLLPAYRALGEWPRFPEALYLGQHRKLLAQLQRAQSRLSERSAFGSVPEAVIAILDLETTYKHISEHHDEAEANGLFKALDAGMPVADRVRLLQICSDEFQSALHVELPLLRQAQRETSRRAHG